MNVPASWRRLRAPHALLIIASLSTALYLLFVTLPYPLLSHYATPLLDLGKLAHYSQNGALAFMLSFSALFVLYALALRLVRDTSQVTKLSRLVFLPPVVFAFILIWASPLGAIDVYDYAFESRMLAAHHANPITHMPLEFSADPWFAYVAWQSATAPYGPVWVTLGGIVYTLTGGDLLRVLLSFKLVAALSLLANAALAYAILRRWRPADALSGFLLVAWNPLLLFELAANAHNDGLMLTFVLLGLYAFQRQRVVSASLLVVAATLVKFPAIIVLPFLWLCALLQTADWRARWRTVGAAVVASLAAFVLAYLPLWREPDLLNHILPRQNLFTTSFAALGALWLGGDAATLVRTAALALFTGALALLALKVDETFDSLAHAALAALLLLVVVATFWFQPWYLVWLVPLAPLARLRARTLVMLFSWSALWDYFIYDFAWYWWPDFFNRDSGLTLNLSAVLLIFGPPLLYLAAHSLRLPRLAARRWSLAPTRRTPIAASDE